MLRVKSHAKLQILNFWQFFKMCNFDFVFFFFFGGGGGGGAQNAGVLIDLVFFSFTLF